MDAVARIIFPRQESTSLNRTTVAGIEYQLLTMASI